MKKILVVNNDIDTMTLLKSWLEKKAYSVKYTSNTDEVLDLVIEFNPELVLIDILQNAAIEQLRINHVTRSVPILLMTGYTLKHKNNQLPVDDIIEKPFNLNLLETKIERLIVEKSKARKAS